MLLMGGFLAFAPARAAEVTVQGSVELRTGFNAVGVPVDPAAFPDTQALLPHLGTASQLDRLLARDPATGFFEETAYDQSGQIIGTAVPVRVGEAWIVYAKQPLTVNYDVTLTCPQYDLEPGLRLLSFPFVGNQTTAYGVLQALGGPTVVSSIQGFDPESGKFAAAVYKEDGAAAGPDFPISPALGYFVAMRTAMIYDPVPVLNTLTPNPVEAGSGTFQLNLSGAHFVPSSTVTAGSTILPSQYITSTLLTATVPEALVAAPGSFAVTVTSGPPGCGTSNTVSLLVEAQGAVPEITQFSPADGTISTEVTIEGLNFDAVLSNNQVAFNGTSAIITSATPTEIVTEVPLGATTGPITVTTLAGTATSADPFTITPRGDFTLSAVPEQATTLQGGQTTYSLSVTGSGDFTGLVSLEVTGLPSGITAQFVSQKLTSGQTTTLTVSVDSSVAVGTIPLTVTGSSLLDTGPHTQSIPLSLQVQAGGRTSVSGQFLLTDRMPVPNVQVRLGATQTLTDAGGNFLMVDVPSGVQQLAITGPAALGGFGYAVDFTLVADQVNVLPIFWVTPPPPPEDYVPIDNAAAPQVVENPKFPGASITLPVGVTIIGWDNIPKTQITVQKMELDRLGIPQPPKPTHSVYQAMFGTPMGGFLTPTGSVLPVTVPNDLGLEPGQQAELWVYDAAPTGEPAAWKLAGLATVSADGSTIVSNPGVGVTRFCHKCGAWSCTPAGSKTPPPTSPDPRICKLETGGEPVDLCTGLFNMDRTDLSLSGRIPLNLSRTYHPIDAYGGVSGLQLSLGLGWVLSVDVTLLPNPNGQFYRLVLPSNIRLDLSRQPDGTFVNRTHPFLRGAVLRILANGDRQLRFKDGTTWLFRSLFTFPDGSRVEFMIEQADRNGNRITIERSGHQITRIFDSAGRAINVTSSGGRITRLQDPIGRTVSYSYGSNGRLASVTDPAGGVTTYTYDSADHILTITDARGIQFVQNFYGPSGRTLRQVHLDGGEFRFRYQLQGATVTGPGCPGMACPTEDSWEKFQAGYNVTGGTVMATTVVDPDGHARTSRFNSIGLPIERIDGLGQRTALVRDAGNLVMEVIDPLGHVTKSTYDNAGKVTSITDPLGNTTLFEYEPLYNQLTRYTDALGNVTTFTYDANGNQLSSTDPLGHTTTFLNDAFGQPLTVTDPLGNTTTFEYDTVGNLIAVIDSLGNKTNYRYDAVSRRIETIDPLGQRTTTTYDPLDRVVEHADAKGGKTQTEYDEVGNVLSVTDARGNAISFTYDDVSRLKTRTDSLGHIDSRAYDLSGNVTEFVDRRGQSSTFTYDALNRLVSENYHDGSTVSRVYDSLGHLLRTDDSSGGMFLFTYDARGRLLRSVGPFGTVNYARDKLGRVSQRQVVGQPPVDYSYDPVGNLLSAGTTAATVNYTYDNRNQILSQNRSNGVNTDYTYDSLGRVLSINHAGTAGIIDSQTYAYDPVGNIVEKTADIAQPLITQPTVNNFDAASNQLLQSGAVTFTHDANGNRLTETGPTGTTTYVWDSRNRLDSIVSPNGETTTFRYDYAGNLIEESAVGPGVNVTKSYILDNLTNVISRRNDVGKQFTVLTGQGIDQHLALINSNGQVEYGLRDAINNTVVTVNQTGTLQDDFFYEPFGETTTGSSYPFQYTGRVPVSNGLYHNRARYYDPKAGRFVSEDPIGLYGGINLYKYGSNNPINRSDPFGLLDCSFDPAVLKCQKELNDLRIECFADGGDACLVKIGVKSAECEKLVIKCNSRKRPELSCKDDPNCDCSGGLEHIGVY